MITDERLREMLAGCQGVTPGPWIRHESDRETSVVAPATGTVVVVPWGANTTAFHNAHRDAGHLSRLDPQTITSIVTELLSRREADEWRPIETAPKDGTTIFLTNGGWVDTGWWSTSLWIGGSANAGWVTDDEREIGIVHQDITHWRPLPQPPQGSTP